MRAFITILAIGIAGVAWADNTADEADVAFSRGVRAYQHRDYEGALSNYFLSYRLVPNRNVLFNIARCFEALKRRDEAYRYWHDLYVDPALPAEDKPDVKAALARLAPHVALLRVTSAPTEGELFVDREDLGSRGRTPKTVAVKPGSHLVLVKADGFRSAQVKVTAQQGREAQVAVTLTPIVGTVELSGTPLGAVIRETEDGPELGTLPSKLSFSPGQRLFLVQAPGHLPQQVLVDLKADTSVAVTVKLPEKAKPTGKVSVTSNREQAEVLVDGQRAGFTPTVLNLSEGPHQLSVVAADVSPFEQRIEVVADQELRIAADLRYAPPKVTAASKQLLSVDQAPASVTVITREEIQAFGYQTLPEALRAVRGFFFSDDRIYTYMGIRGFLPPGDLNTRILVLWDGHSMNDTWAGQGYSARDFEPDLSEVDRIEVVRGPTSLLFGTGAVFGVINVVPRNRITDRHVEGVIGAGGVGGLKARVTGSLGGDDLSAILSAVGYTATGAELTDLGEAGVVRALDDERSIGANGRFKYKDLSVTGKWTQRRKQIPTAPLGSTVGLPGTQYTDVRGFAELKFEHEFLSRLSITARGSYDASRFRGTYANLDESQQQVRATDLGGADWFTAEVRAGVPLFTGNRLTLAVEGQMQLVYQQPVGFTQLERRTRYLFSGTLLDEWQLWGERLFIQAGARVDKYNDIAEYTLSPRGAVVLKPYSTGLTKLVAGRAFRSPNTYELYFTDRNRTQIAPPTGSLTPEYITTFELEHSHNVTPELRLTAGGYFNLIDQLVVLQEENATPPRCLNDTQCFGYSNATKRLNALGAEAQIRWQPGRFTLVEANYSFVTLGGPGIDDAPAYPAHLGSVRALLPIRAGVLRLSGQATYQSGRFDRASMSSLGEALILNFGLSGEYGPVRYFAGVNNLLDQRPLLPVVGDVGASVIPQYGRTFWIELATGY